jgi:hypothetical protein
LEVLHFDLTKGVQRRWVDCEVSATALDRCGSLIDSALSGIQARLPLREVVIDALRLPLSLTATREGQSLRASVLAGGTMEILSLAIGCDKVGGALLWRAMHRLHTARSSSSRPTDPLHVPDPPWCASAYDLNPGMSPSILFVRNGLELGIAWAWIFRILGRTLRRA